MTLGVRRFASYAAVGLALVGVVSSLPGSASGIVRTRNAWPGDHAPTRQGALGTSGAAGTSGAPVTGGTLNVRSDSDVDYLDPNITYYSVGYAVAREYSRQLYSYPAVNGQTSSVVPDLATAMPVVTDGGKTVSVTIQTGAMWDTHPATQVTAKDEIRGVEMTCNPFLPFGGTVDFSSLIVGYPTFCKHFARARPTVSGIRKFLATNTLRGVTVGSTPETVVFHLTRPTSYFTGILTLPALSPRSAATLKYLPGSAQEAQHTISDGPYEVVSYKPGKEIDFDRNPAWDATTDAVRAAYADQIDWTITANDAKSVTLMEDGSPAADICECSLDPAEVENRQQAGDPDLSIEDSIATDPQLTFNTVSPNNGGALENAAVRQAISFGLDRTKLDAAIGPTDLFPALTQILPSQIDGSSNFDRYPYDPAKAKAKLASLGETSLTLKVLYRSADPTSIALLKKIRTEMAAIGVKVDGVSASTPDFYVKYLLIPSAARAGLWDIAITGWAPDWYGDAADSFFEPLYDGRHSPPSSEDFGLFKSAKVDKLIDEASQAAYPADVPLWTKTDHAVMNAAPVFPLTDPNVGEYHAAQSNNVVFVPYLGMADPTNVWLNPDDNDH